MLVWILVVLTSQLLLSASQSPVPNPTSPVILPSSTTTSTTTSAATEPSVFCYDVRQTNASASYDDCRQLLAIFRLDHPNTFWYTLVHTSPTNPQEIWCPYTMKQGTCMLSLDFDERVVQNPLVYISVVNQWVCSFNIMCVIYNKGSGGKVMPMGINGGVGLKLVRYM